MAPHASRVRFALAVAVVALIAAFGASVHAQSNPYRTIENWAKLPGGRIWGATSAITVDRHDNVWVFERCGAEDCVGSNLAPIVEFDPSGKVLKSFGAGMFVYPHTIYVDKDDNVWAVDGEGKAGKGQQVIKFSPDGKVLMALGKAGVAGDGPDTFNRPSAVVVTSNGDIFVADGHGKTSPFYEGTESNARVVKFSKDGKFIKQWGKKGSGPGEFDSPHAIATDSKGRLFVGDRNNVRVEIFDLDGKFLAEWKQFGRPSGVFIDANDNLYVSGVQLQNSSFKQGIRIGGTQDGIVKFLIPGLGPDTKPYATEGIAADSKGNVYGAGSHPHNGITKYVKN